MTDLVERLRSQRRATKWKRGVDIDYPVEFEPDPLCAEAADELTRLRAEVEALRADAERYRYLRNRDPAVVLASRFEEAGCWIDCENHFGTLTLITGKHADAAIDEARTK